MPDACDRYFAKPWPGLARAGVTPGLHAWCTGSMIVNRNSDAGFTKVGCRDQEAAEISTCVQLAAAAPKDAASSQVNRVWLASNDR